MDEQIAEEIEHWKRLFHEQTAKTRQLEEELGLQSSDKASEVKTQLRFACSQNDKALLQRTIAEAEALGMSEVDYARRKLARLLNG